MGKKNVEPEPEPIVTTQPKPMDYMVSVTGVLQIKIEQSLESKDYIRGVVVGQVNSQIPKLKILNATIQEVL